MVSRYSLSGRFQQVERELRKQMETATDRKALIAALMEDVARRLPHPEKDGSGSVQKKIGEKAE